MVAPPKCPRHSATVHCTAVAVGAFCVCVLRAVQPSGTPGEGYVVITYTLSRKGAQLAAAGMIPESREYSKSTDPFALPRRLRYLALHKFGLDFDDASSFPRAALHLIPVGRGRAGQLIRHKKEIVRAMKERWMPTDTEAEEKIKVLINGVEMHMAMHTWRSMYGVPPPPAGSETRSSTCPRAAPFRTPSTSPRT